MRRQKHFLLFITNPWHYENKQGTIKKPYKNATRTAKFFFIFFKKCWFWGPILKNLCLRKMGMASIKWWPCLSTIPSFLININEEAFLKVSFKNIDWFQIWKNYFFQKGPKNTQILKNLKGIQGICSVGLLLSTVNNFLLILMKIAPGVGFCIWKMVLRPDLGKKPFLTPPRGAQWGQMGSKGVKS